MALLALLSSFADESDAVLYESHVVLKTPAALALLVFATLQQHGVLCLYSSVVNV